MKASQVTGFRVQTPESRDSTSLVGNWHELSRSVRTLRAQKATPSVLKISTMTLCILLFIMVLRTLKGCYERYYRVPLQKP